MKEKLHRGSTDALHLITNYILNIVSMNTNSEPEHVGLFRIIDASSIWALAWITFSLNIYRYINTVRKEWVGYGILTVSALFAICFAFRFPRIQMYFALSTAHRMISVEFVSNNVSRDRNIKCFTWIWNRSTWTIYLLQHVYMSSTTIDWLRKPPIDFQLDMQ